MSDCIDALITANIKAALQTVTPANGYNTDCGTVEEKRSLFRMPDDNKPFTMLEKLPHDPENDYQYSQDDQLKYMIYYFNQQDDLANNAQPLQYTDRNVAADFQKALMVDRTRGGYAQNTTIQTHAQGMYLSADENIAIPCTWMIVIVDRQINADNPYELA